MCIRHAPHDESSRRRAQRTLPVNTSAGCWRHAAPTAAALGLTATASYRRWAGPKLGAHSPGVSRVQDQGVQRSPPCTHVQPQGEGAPSQPFTGRAPCRGAQRAARRCSSAACTPPPARDGDDASKSVLWCRIDPAYAPALRAQVRSSHACMGPTRLPGPCSRACRS